MLRTHRAVMLEEAGREKEAESDYRAGLRFSPEDPIIHLNLARLLARGGIIDEASSLLDLPALQDNADALYLRAVIAVRAKELSMQRAISMRRSLREAGFTPRRAARVGLAAGGPYGRGPGVDP
jgi:Flp pilus assembly protein TadD